MRIKHALIMAAGRGQRMMPLTADMPKPMAPFKGTTLIANGIDKIRKHIPNIHITVGYKGAMLAGHVIQQGVSTVINTEGKSNSWWIYKSLLAILNEPVFVLTCDNVIELDFNFLEHDYFESGEPACMVVPVKPIRGLEGDYIFRRGRVVSEISRSRISDIYCSGIQVINPFKVTQLTRCEEGGDFYCVWQELIKESQMLCSKVYPKEWIAVDTVDQLDSMNGGNSTAGAM